MTAGPVDVDLQADLLFATKGFHMPASIHSSHDRQDLQHYVVK